MTQAISKMETTQTAVEWLIKEFNLESYEATVKFALEKEKGQIEEAYLNGLLLNNKTTII